MPFWPWCSLLCFKQNCTNTMKPNPDKSKGEFAKLLTAACVRRGFLEKLHAGITPVTRTGDYSDVKVIDAEGREIPWNQVSRINQDEMKILITGVVNRIHTFLIRTILSVPEDKAFGQAVDRAVVPWIKAWDQKRIYRLFLTRIRSAQLVARQQRPLRHAQTCAVSSVATTVRLPGFTPDGCGMGVPPLLSIPKGRFCTLQRVSECRRPSAAPERRAADRRARFGEVDAFELQHGLGESANAPTMNIARTRPGAKSLRHPV